MGRQIKQFAPFIITSSGSTVTNAVTGLSDTVSLQIFCATSASGTFFNVQGSPFLSSRMDPLAYQQVGSVTSGFYALQSVQTSGGGLIAILPGQTLVLFPVEGHGMHQIRLLGTGAETSGQVCGWMTGQIDV